MGIKLFRQCKNQVLVFGFFVAPLFFSCRTMADYNYAQINRNLANGNFSQIRQELEQNSSMIYSSHDELLKNLDNGILLHYDLLYEISNQKLSDAEKLAQTYSAKSITQSILSAMTNDTVRDYAGEDFENLYTNIFMALNYINLGEYEDAMVEVRRFDNKIKLLRTKYEEQIERFDSQSDSVKVDKVLSRFSDSAFARYLSMLMYRTQGDSGNAEVDLKYLKNAFTAQKALYDFKIPSCVNDEISVPNDKARLNVVAFSGRAPLKKEDVIRVYWGPSVWYKLALPVMEKRKSSVTKISVSAVNNLTGQKYSSEVEKLESLEDIAVDTFQQAYSIMYARSLARSIARAVTNSSLSSLTDEANRRNDFGAALIFTTMDIAHKIATETVERADIRSSRYFPATASVAGINLEPGNYTVTVEFYSGRSVISKEVKKMTLRVKELNLVESVCLR